jgi:hypothetical protein
MKTILVLVAAFLLAACSGLAAPSGTSDLQAAASPTPTLPPLVLVPVTPAAEEIASASGEGPGSSDPFTITEKSWVRVNWQQSSTGKFVLKVVNSDPAQAGTAYGEVTFDVTTGPSALALDYEFIPGQYKIEVASADGPWKVWIQYIGPGQ